MMIHRPIARLSLTAACLVGCAKGSADRGEPTTAADAAVTAAASEQVAPGAESPAGADVIETSSGPLTITPIHHATVVFGFAGKTLVVDPYSEGDLSHVPKADYVFITDIHADHLDLAALAKVSKDTTTIVTAPAVVEKLTSKPAALVSLKNGESHDFGSFSVEAVPMYNLERGPAPGKLYHDKGRGDGFVIRFGDKRVYLSGDTECTPEMKALTGIDVAFVCMNLPYTMTPVEAAECIKVFKPKVLYPYHYRGSDLSTLTQSLSGTSGIEVRLRKWY